MSIKHRHSDKSPDLLLRRLKGKNFANGLIKRVMPIRPLCYFVGSKLIHPANPFMYEPNPTRSPLIALSCVVDVFILAKIRFKTQTVNAIINKRWQSLPEPTSYRFVKQAS